MITTAPIPNSQRQHQAIRMQRMLWRCRRGLLELDLVLQTFIKQHFTTLELAQLDTLNALLDLPDQTLWQRVNGSSDCESDAERNLISLMRQVTQEELC